LIMADATALAGAPAAAAPEAPAVELTTEEVQAGASAGLASTEGVRGRRIIIVEDAVLLALELESGLNEAGAQVVGMAADVEKGLRLANTAVFDVAVADAHLNGPSVAPGARALTPRGTPFPIAAGDRGPGLAA